MHGHASAMRRESSLPTKRTGRLFAVVSGNHALGEMNSSWIVHSKQTLELAPSASPYFDDVHELEAVDQQEAQSWNLSSLHRQGVLNDKRLKRKYFHLLDGRLVALL